MNKIKNNLLLFGVLAFLLISGCGPQSNPYDTRFDVSYEQLKKEFQNPPNNAKIRAYWWWLNSNVTKECITKDLEAMKANGYGGAIIFDAGSSNYRVAKKTEAGPAFLSEEWLDLFAHAVSEADRLGLELSINVQSGWNPGGPSVTPEDAMKKMTWSDTTVTGPGKFESELPVPAFQNMFKDVKVLAVRNLSDTASQATQIKDAGIKTLNQPIGWKGIYPLHLLREEYKGTETPLKEAEVTDISGYFEDEKLRWDIPAGNWTILRFGMTNTGAKVSTASDGWGGLSLDHLNRDALMQYHEDVISRLIQTAQEAGDALEFIHTDSWEMGVANWTDDFMEEFRERRGYDMTPYLPVLTNRIVGSRDISNRFLHDFRRTVADLVAGEFYEPFREIARENDLFTHPESGGPHSAPIDAIQTMKYNDVPMGEFWVRSNTHRIKDAERLAVKQSASVAHIYGKRFVAAEGPTSIGPQWERPPKDCKNVIDRIFCSGVNRIVWHTYTASPDEYGEPGNSYFAGTHLNRHVTWWEEAGAFIEYMNRTSSMLSQGLFTADALYYYGDDSPNFVFLKDEVTDLGPGYSWDKCSYDLIMEDITIEEGRIVLPDGMSYRLLVLPEEPSIKPELLEKLRELVNQGMILVGSKPQKASGLKGYPGSDERVNRLADELWGNSDGDETAVNRVGKGKVFRGKSPGEVLESLKIPPDFDFHSAYPDTYLDFIHRRTSSEDIYFVVNRLARHGINDTQYRYLPDLPDRYEEVVCSFRVTGKVPELWDPVTGKIREIVVYREEDGMTHIPLHLPPEGSLFVVFREDNQENYIHRVEKDGVVLFPAVSKTVSLMPSFWFFREDNQVTGQVQEAGNWIFHWSDGTVSSTDVSAPVDSYTLETPWEVHFEEHWGPQEKVRFDTLMSWSTHPDERIKYYAGSATYFNSFFLEEDKLKNRSIRLDLGNVQEIASVKVNGKEVGISWIAPFVHDITPFVQEGENKLEVTVTNSWVNRLIGDGSREPAMRYTQTNVVKFDAADAEKYMRVSGLLGPVKIFTIKQTSPFSED